MNQLLSDNLWPAIRRLAKKSAVKRAAVAYVTSEAFVTFGESDVLITDASDAAIAGGQTSAKLLSRALKRGAELHSVPGLHAKVFVLDGTAVIGSANLSESSSNAMIEAAWVTDAPAAVGMATALIQQLKKQGTVIDQAFVKRVLRIKVKRIVRRGRPSAHQRVKVPKHRTWILGVHEVVREFPEEEAAIEKGNAIAERNLTQESSETSWIRWTGNSRFRREAKRGDSVIQIWSPHGAKKPAAVIRHAPIVHRQDEKTCTRFFVEDFEDEEETELSWAQFNKLYKRLNIPGRIGRGSERPISEAHSEALHALWCE
jgi:phosphatidylserine/phosphatidylglycerophosphate/cardiolipin synthase-like enzyme